MTPPLLVNACRVWQVGPQPTEQDTRTGSSIGVQLEAPALEPLHQNRIARRGALHFWLGDRVAEERQGLTRTDPTISQLEAMATPVREEVATQGMACDGEVTATTRRRVH